VIVREIEDKIRSNQIQSSQVKANWSSYRCALHPAGKERQRTILDASFPVPRGIPVLQELVVSYFMYSGVAMGEMSGKVLSSHTEILAAATGDRSLQLSCRPIFFPHLFPPAARISSLSKSRSEEKLTAVRLQRSRRTKKKRKTQETHAVASILPSRTGRPFKSRNFKVDRDRPAVDR
jgi:hypothetical protein